MWHNPWLDIDFSLEEKWKGWTEKSKPSTQEFLCTDYVQSTLPNSAKRGVSGTPLCCVACLMKTRGHLSSPMHSSQKEPWLPVPVNASAGASLLREFSLVPLCDQAAVGSCGAVSLPYARIQPHHVCSDPHPPRSPCGCQKPPVPLVCCSATVNLVITQMLSEAMSEHRVKTTSPEGTFGQSGLSVSQKLRHLFDWIRVRIGWFCSEWSLVLLAHISQHSSRLPGLQELTEEWAPQ